MAAAAPTRALALPALQLNCETLVRRRLQGRRVEQTAASAVLALALELGSG